MKAVCSVIFCEDSLAAVIDSMQTEGGLWQVDTDCVDDIHVDSSTSGLICIATFSLAHGSLR